MPLNLSILPHGRLLLERRSDDLDSALSEAAAGRIEQAFAAGTSHGLLHLVADELQAILPGSLAFGRELARRYVTRLCQVPGLETAADLAPISAVQADLSSLLEQVPPMRGSEYLSLEMLEQWWRDLDVHVRSQIRESGESPAAYLRSLNSLWHHVGRVTFHLAENKKDQSKPFAFMATYANRLTQQGSVQHLPLARALKEYAGDANREALVSLLTPISQASEACGWIKAMVDSGSIFQALAWSPSQAHQFLMDVPAMQTSGLVVRVPDWWKTGRPPRPQVNVRIGDAPQTRLGVGALLDFSVSVTIEGGAASQADLKELLSSGEGLVRLGGRWVEVDRERLDAALKHWKRVEKDVRQGGLTYFEGMRLLAGAPIDAAGEADQAAAGQFKEWTGLVPGDWLSRTLEELRSPQLALGAGVPRDLQATLRPYQVQGLAWLRFMTRLGLGGCLADDMGLGKTVQVLALLLRVREDEGTERKRTRDPSLLVVPASLIGNWKAEIAKFAPSLSMAVLHPSESTDDLDSVPVQEALISGKDLIITTYGMLTKLEGLLGRTWNLVILDEAQAIKNAGTRQSRSVKQLKATGRIALTGTPIENRLSDLWSLFDFLNPGLLGSSKDFGRYVKAISGNQESSFAPLRALVKPYILRRLKTDRKIISDLPEKTELKVYCGLSRKQTALYARAVAELGEQIKSSEGIKRRGIVLAFLTRLKQICNHPSQWLGDLEYAQPESGKFERLAQLCEELSQRQERALIFTQFREITDPLAALLGRIFQRPGLILHGGVAVSKRREMVEAFARDDGPPFFVLSLKAGGTGLNLTNASHVIHFDRWWNPAVENQATDRAFRIGQQRNVMVHKFVCRGTLEEKIDEIIAAKSALSEEILEGGAERLLTEMSDSQLLEFVSLDINRAAQD